jgi:hypothetical protein
VITPKITDLERLAVSFDIWKESFVRQ